MYVTEIYTVTNPSSWGFLALAYLTLIAISSGCAIVVSTSMLLGKMKGAKARTRMIAISFIAIVLAPIALIFELAHPERFLSVINPANFQPSSPMSWGSLILTLYGLVVFVAFILSIRRKTIISDASESNTKPLELPKPLLALCLAFGLALSLYPGYELGINQSNPFISSDIMPLVFLLSSLLAGAGVTCLVITLDSGECDVEASRKVNLLVVAICVLIVALVVSWTLSSLVSGDNDVVSNLWGSASFTGGFLVVGLLAPSVIASIPQKACNRPFAALICALILLGCVFFRFTVLFVAFPA